jgi:hypothetical protein
MRFSTTVLLPLLSLAPFATAIYPPGNQPTTQDSSLGTQTYIIRLKPDSPVSDVIDKVTSVLSQHGGTVKDQLGLINGLSVKLPPAVKDVVQGALGSQVQVSGPQEPPWSRWERNLFVPLTCLFPRFVFSLSRRTAPSKSPTSSLRQMVCGGEGMKVEGGLVFAKADYV